MRIELLHGQWAAKEDGGWRVSRAADAEFTMVVFSERHPVDNHEYGTRLIITDIVESPDKLPVQAITHGLRMMARYLQDNPDGPEVSLE